MKLSPGIRRPSLACRPVLPVGSPNRHGGAYGLERRPVLAVAASDRHARRSAPRTAQPQGSRGGAATAFRPRSQRCGGQSRNGRSRQEPSPLLYELPSPLEQVSAAVGRLDGVRVHLRQRRLAHLPGARPCTPPPSPGSSTGTRTAPLRGAAAPFQKQTLVAEHRTEWSALIGRVPAPSSRRPSKTEGQRFRHGDDARPACGPRPAGAPGRRPTATRA